MSGDDCNDDDDATSVMGSVTVLRPMFGEVASAGGGGKGGCSCLWPVMETASRLRRRCMRRTNHGIHIEQNEAMMRAVQWWVRQPITGRCISDSL